MFINKPVLSKFAILLSLSGFTSLGFSQQAILPSPMAGTTQVIEAEYPEPSKIKLPNGEIVEMTIGTLADMQKKSEIRDFEEKVESIFAPDTRRQGGINGISGNINGFPVNLPPPTTDLTPPKPPEPEFVVETRAITVVSVYGKRNSLMTEIQTVDGLLNVGENSMLTAGYRVGEISSSGVRIIGPKGNAIVPIGASVTYEVKVKR